MAEGFFKAIYGDRSESYSAGLRATIVNPRAVQVMKEAGRQSKIIPENPDLPQNPCDLPGVKNFLLFHKLSI
jgi:hypothetical protein